MWGGRLHLGEPRETSQPSPKQRPLSTISPSLTQDQGEGRYLSPPGRAEGSQVLQPPPHLPHRPGPTPDTPKTTPGEEQGRAASWRQSGMFIQGRRSSGTELKLTLGLQW